MTSIAFTGDIAFSRYFKDRWQTDFLDPDVEDFLRNADHVAANVECPMTEAAVTSELEIVHFSAPASGRWLKSISADIWNLANNHILDCGESGMEDTMAAARANGATPIGAGKNIDEASRYLSLPQSGGIGIFALTYKRAAFMVATPDKPGCVMFTEEERIRKIVREIKSRHRWCVLIAHGGDEFCNLPMPYMRKLYRSFLKMGVDVVVGHHPHVVQHYEQIGKQMIFYSLGNFVFDTDYQRRQNYSEYGILLKLHFDEDAYTWEYKSIRINRQTQRVEAWEAPTVFCRVREADYRLLWPLAARKFTENFEDARTSVLPAALDFRRKDWFRLHREKHGLKNALWLYCGKYLSYLSVWRLADKALRAYVEEP